MMSIQLKLESWKPPKPSENSLKARLFKATERREHSINKVVSRAAAKSNRVKTVTSELIIEKRCKEESLVEGIEKKMSEAAKRKYELNAQNLRIVREKNQKKVLTNEILKAKIERREDIAKISLETKLRSGKERKELNLGDKKQKVLMANKLVASRVARQQRELESNALKSKCNYENKLISAGRRKERHGKQNCTEEKVERVKHHKLAQDASASSLKDALEERITNAARRKKSLIFARASKASAHCISVSKRVQDLQIRHNLTPSKQKDTQSKETIKFDQDQSHKIVKSTEQCMEDVVEQESTKSSQDDVPKSIVLNKSFLNSLYDKIASKTRYLLSFFKGIIFGSE